MLDTALGAMNTAPHQYVGEMLHGRIIGALELCCRRGEMLLIQNKRLLAVDLWARGLEAAPRGLGHRGGVAIDPYEMTRRHDTRGCIVST